MPKDGGEHSRAQAEKTNSLKPSFLRSVMFLMPSMKSVFFFLFVLIRWSTLAQDQNAFVQSDDAKYFNFWEGTWYLVKDDNTIDTAIYFKVKRSVHPSAFEEEWNGSFAIRAWDKTNNKWGFTWISDNGLFQNWDSRKVGSDWYIYKQFMVNGIHTFHDKVLYSNRMVMSFGKVKNRMMRKLGSRDLRNG
jgi:hypothetical protein